jgi:hypothetical protein
MDRAALKALFSRPPASFQWARDEGRDIDMGTSIGSVLEIGDRHAALVALFPPDQPQLAARNGTLMQLLLVALRPDWPSASGWLVEQLQAATKATEPYDAQDLARYVRFRWDRQHSRATLEIDLL